MHVVIYKLNIQQFVVKDMEDGSLVTPIVLANSIKNRSRNKRRNL